MKCTSVRGNTNKGKNRSLSYLELAEQLPQYIKDNGFTSCGVPSPVNTLTGAPGDIATGYYAPTYRYGTPEEFTQLISALQEMACRC